MITKNEENFDSDQLMLKKKSYQLRFNVVKNYLEKNFKKFREWKRSVRKKFEISFKYFSNNYDKIMYAQKDIKKIVDDLWKARKK